MNSEISSKRMEEPLRKTNGRIDGWTLNGLINNLDSFFFFELC